MAIGAILLFSFAGIQTLFHGVEFHEDDCESTAEHYCAPEFHHHCELCDLFTGFAIVNAKAQWIPSDFIGIVFEDLQHQEPIALWTYPPQGRAPPLKLHS